MKQLQTLFLLLACLSVILLFPGCGGGHKSSGRSASSGGGSGGGGGGGTGTGTGTGGTGGGSGGGSGTASIGSLSCFTSLDDIYSTMNGWRQMYGGVGGYGYHDRYKGFPWRGEQHTNQTWPITFQRDSGLEAKAQAEAERINAGGTPKGEQRSGLYLDGVDTANYIIACKELDSTSMGKEGPPMSKNWGTARLAIHYHDAGGDGPVITKIGIGAVDAGEGHTWWVLWYGE